VPLGTALGQAAGWRSTFWAVASIGVVAVTALARWLPSELPAGQGSIVGDFKAIATWPVQCALLISTLASISMFSVLTYIAYLLRDVTGFTPDQASGALMLFGAGITVGGLVGGRLADWRLMPALAGLFVCIALVLAVFSWSVHAALPALATLFVWGIVAFAVGPAAQVRVLDAASAAPNLASTLNQGAFNLGNASGAWLGGLLIAAGRPLTELPWLGAAVALAALAVVALSVQLDRPGRLAAARG